MTCKMLTSLTMISQKSLVQTNLLDCKSKPAGFLSDKSWKEKTVKLRDNSLLPIKMLQQNSAYQPKEQPHYKGCKKCVSLPAGRFEMSREGVCGRSATKSCSQCQTTGRIFIYLHSPRPHKVIRDSASYLMNSEIAILVIRSAINILSRRTFYFFAYQKESSFLRKRIPDS